MPLCTLPSLTTCCQRTLFWLSGCLLFPLMLSGQPDTSRLKPDAVSPGIGLALSGGGAKGLAHIGILQAIDEAGLKIDYLSGTSMGGVIGGLYAAGYSGDSIEALVNSIDWEKLFLSKPLLENIALEEKDEYDRYAFEMPVRDRRLKYRSGLIEGQELWLVLSEVFFPVYDKKSFDEFDIPFRCVATDLATGNAVEIDSGEIAQALRASMSIPSVFTPVTIDGVTYIDGGVTRNFPVRNVRDMGAGYIIGSTVASGLRKPEELRNPLDVIYQMGFFKDASEYNMEVELCDVLIKPDLSLFSSASFRDADEIIEAGKKAGRAMLPEFKRIADSLDAAYSDERAPFTRLPKKEKLFIETIEVRGLDESETGLFKGSLPAWEDGYVTGRVLRNAINELYGTRRYETIHYKLVPLGNERAELIFNVKAALPLHVKGGLNFNSGTGSSLILNITDRNFLLPNSMAFASFNIGEDPRLRMQYLKYLGSDKENAFVAATYLENIVQPHYREGDLQQEFNAFYVNGGVRFLRSPGQNQGYGIGTIFEYRNLTRRISGVDPSGSLLANWHSYLFYEWNTMDRKHHPVRGNRFNLQIGWLYNHSFRFLNGDQAELDFISPRLKLHVNYKGVFEISSKWRWTHEWIVNWIQGRDVPIPQKYQLGGMDPVNHHLSRFPGLETGGITTASHLSAIWGVHREVYRRLYLEAHLSTAFIDFGETSPTDWSAGQLVIGESVGISYNSRFGPISFNLMHSFYSNNIRPYVNIGHYF